MTDIKDYVPDTSKYTDPADRLIALGLAMNDGRPVYYRSKDSTEWEESGGVVSLDFKVANVLSGYDYRAKPEPRVVWVNLNENGAAWHYGSEPEARANSSRHHALATAVRVELPELEKAK